MRIRTHIIHHTRWTRPEALYHRYFPRGRRKLEIPPHTSRDYHPGNVLSRSGRYIETSDHGRLRNDHARVSPRDICHRRWGQDRNRSFCSRYLPDRSRLCGDESYPPREKSSQMRSVDTSALPTHGTRSDTESDPNYCLFTDCSILTLSDIHADDREGYPPYRDRYHHDISHRNPLDCEKKVIRQYKKFCKIYIFIVYFVSINSIL